MGVEKDGNLLQRFYSLLILAIVFEQPFLRSPPLKPEDSRRYYVVTGPLPDMGIDEIFIVRAFLLAAQSSFRCVERVLCFAQILCRHQSSLTVVLGEHILGRFTLTMATIADNGQTHILVPLIVAHQLLEVFWQFLELGLVSKAILEQLRLELDLVLKVSKRGALQIFRVLLGGQCRLRGVMVGARKFMEAACLGQVFPVQFLCLSLLVDGHGVFHEVAARAEISGSLLNPPEVLFFEGALVLGHEAASGLVVEAAGNFLLKALSCVI